MIIKIYYFINNMSEIYVRHIDVYDSETRNRVRELANLMYGFNKIKNVTEFIKTLPTNHDLHHHLLDEYNFQMPSIAEFRLRYWIYE